MKNPTSFQMLKITIASGASWMIGQPVLRPDANWREEHGVEETIAMEDQFPDHGDDDPAHDDRDEINRAEDGARPDPRIER